MQEEGKPIERQLVERDAARRSEPKAQHAFDPARCLQVDITQFTDVARVRNRCDFQGPQAKVVPGSVGARGLIAFADIAAQEGPAWYQKAITKDALHWVR